MGVTISNGCNELAAHCTEYSSSQCRLGLKLPGQKNERAITIITRPESTPKTKLACLLVLVLVLDILGGKLWLWIPSTLQRRIYPLEIIIFFTSVISMTGIFSSFT